jgi:hypothetical protein
MGPRTDYLLETNNKTARLFALLPRRAEQTLRKMRRTARSNPTVLYCRSWTAIMASPMRVNRAPRPSAPMLCAVTRAPSNSK